MLPEEILLEIFSSYVFGIHDNWQTLVHVCQRWRSIVFAAPRHLNLRLRCTARTPAREMLYIWPELPIVVMAGEPDYINDDIIFALEKHDRICEVHAYHLLDGPIEALAGAMQVTFPALTHLHVRSAGYGASLPETLLGGSAPSLRSLHLADISFPALPKLLLSSPGLVSLTLFENSHSGNISSDAVVDSLPSLTRLEHLQIEFQSSELHPDGASRLPPLLKRTVFPVLKTLHLRRETEYLDQVLACIEAPRLHNIRIGFLDPPIFDISRLSPCIGPTETFETFDEAYICYDTASVSIILSSKRIASSKKWLKLSLYWEDSGWKLEGLYRHFFYQPFNHCCFDESLQPIRKETRENLPWLHLVRFFTATKYLYLSQALAKCVAPALQELTGVGATEVLPVLRNIFVKRLDSLGAVQEAIGQFVATRQLLSGHPIDVQCWGRGE
jgi:hypothetical protein